MKCPHCLISFHDDWTAWSYVSKAGRIAQCQDSIGIFGIRTTECPECKQLICKVDRRLTADLKKHTTITAYPKATARPVAPEIDVAFANDFEEACLVIVDSEKASAALSRRCLQNLLIEKAKTKETRNLAAQIQEVLDSDRLPSHLAQAVDGVRVIGNFAAHPIKSMHTGEVIEVEPGEAEWLLDTLEGFFDFYFVQPAILEKKKNALNKKLREAGKPLLKT